MRSHLIKNVRNMRLIYGIAIGITLLLGLASRKYDFLLHDFVAQNSGDALWAMMVYFGFRFLLIRGSIKNAVFLSFLFSFGIEFSQMYQADWINQIRSHLIGGLILGKGFLMVDLIRYSAGIVIGAILDRFGQLWFRHVSPKTEK